MKIIGITKLKNELKEASKIKYFFVEHQNFEKASYWRDIEHKLKDKLLNKKFK